RHTRFSRDWSSDVCSSDLRIHTGTAGPEPGRDTQGLMGPEKVSKKTLPGKTPQALDFKSATLYAIRVVLHSADTTEVLEALARQIGRASCGKEGSARWPPY